MRQIHKWITETSLPLETSQNQSEHPEGLQNNVYRQLILLTTGERLDASFTLDGIKDEHFKLIPKNALFALELEKMMGQIQEAADSALSDPNLYPQLYQFLTQGAYKEDILQWLTESTFTPDANNNDHQAMKKRADVFSRLSKLAKRRLDCLQIEMKFVWSHSNQRHSIILGGVLLFISLIYLEITTGNETGPLDWLRILIASLIGGIVAPVAKDLVVALRKVRQSG